MKFKKIEKIIKAGLSEEEINQFKTKFKNDTWTEYEIYNPDVVDNYDAWDELADIIKYDYLTDEQKENVDSKDIEKIVGMTFEEFSNKRQNFIDRRERQDKFEKYKEDLNVLESILDEKVHQLNFSYDFIEKLYSDKYDLEKKIEQIEGKK